MILNNRFKVSGSCDVKEAAIYKQIAYCETCLVNCYYVCGIQFIVYFIDR